MREALAERLLAQVMNWTPEDVAEERPLLQAMAALKYDEYQQYVPGMRFVESLALWLNQFANMDEKKTAYDFVKNRLVFFSADEIAHLVSIAYPDYIRPLLIRRAAEAANIPDRHVERIARSKDYRALRRQCLFLGLSDGARIDAFRRAATTELCHEQIWQTYEMPTGKAQSILGELRKDLARIPGMEEKARDGVFRMVFLLDDFSGSGKSYLRKESNVLAGKIAKFQQQLVRPDAGMRGLVRENDLYVGIVLYIATVGAVEHLRPLLRDLFRDQPNIDCEIHIVHVLNDDVRLDASRDKAFLGLADRYYDSGAEDEHTRRGGTDVKRGFGGCSLPVVLSHNTPNNSMFLLWANPDDHQIRGLFPRVSRHRSEP